MGKVNRKGRSKSEPFVSLHRGVTESESWKSLTCEARALLIAIWARHNGTNNGRIPYSHREARSDLHIGSSRASRAFKELQEGGFIVVRSTSSFDFKFGAGKGLATEWELTTEPCDGKPPKRLYKDQKVQTTASETKPFGTRGKTVPPIESQFDGQSAPRLRPISPVLPVQRSHLERTSKYTT
jgi:hypothetical protein